MTRRLLHLALLMLLSPPVNAAPAAREGGYHPAWHAAISSADLPRVQSLLRRGTPVDARDRRGSTALMRASAMAKPLLALELLNAGADPYATDTGHKPVVAYVVEADSCEIMESLLQHGLIVDHRYAGGYTALMWAAQSGRYQALQCLLKHGAQKELRNAAGFTALDLAQQALQGDVIALLQDAS